MTEVHTLEEVAAKFKCRPWTIAELVRLKKVSCVRIKTADPKPGEPEVGPIRFTDEHVAQILALLTVEVPQPPARRRHKRRAS